MKKVVNIFKALHIITNDEHGSSGSDDNAGDNSTLDNDTIWQDLDTLDDLLV